MSFKRDLPIDVFSVPFTRYSNYPSNINVSQESPIKQRNIIIGAYNSNNDGFYELVTDNKTKSISYKSFETDYKKAFANLQCMELDRARWTHSYLVKNNKYLVVFAWNDRYNVYDMKNDQWLLNHGDKYLSKNASCNSRSVLINDEILIISIFDNIFFYFIGNDHITDPILIYEYTLKTPLVSFLFHGMSVINFIKQESSKNELYPTYKLKILLFGGYRNKDFLSSFLYLDILLSYISNQEKYQLGCLSIDELLIDKNEIKLINMIKKKEKRWCNFGFECFLNDKNEATIVIIGGNDTTMRNIHLFNCVTYELTRKQTVESNLCCDKYLIMSAIDCCDTCDIYVDTAV